METIKGYKGFDGKLRCRGHQFDVGKTYTCDDAVACKTGFHFCERPQEVFSYYAPAGSRFCEVVGRGKIDRHADDSKIACTEIEIVREITLREMIEICVADTLALAKKRAGSAATGNRGAASATGNQGAASATGDQGAASATGYLGAASATGDQGAASATGRQGAASATGDRGAASATGYLGAASATGYQSIACALGRRCRAMGGESSWLVLAERDDEGKTLCVKSVKVDGETIKAGVWYELVNGEIKEADDA